MWGESLETTDLRRLPNRVQRVCEPKSPSPCHQSAPVHDRQQPHANQPSVKNTHIPYKSSASVHKNRQSVQFQDKVPLCHPLLLSDIEFHIFGDIAVRGPKHGVLRVAKLLFFLGTDVLQNSSLKGLMHQVITHIQSQLKNGYRIHCADYFFVSSLFSSVKRDQL